MGYLTTKHAEKLANTFVISKYMFRYLLLWMKFIKFLTELLQLSVGTKIKVT